MVSTSEAEEKIVHMPSQDFYANVTRITLNKMKLAGIKIPPGSDGIKVTKAKLRSVEQQKR